MSLQTKRKEPPGHALRRVCRRHVERALHGLRRSGHPEAVHHVRKEIKKLRALFRLTRGLLSGAEYRKTAKILRLASKPLAASRDARVIRKAMESLTGRTRGKFTRIHSALAAFSRREQQRLVDDDAGAVVRRLLVQTRDQLGRLDPEGSDWAEIKPRLKQSYTRGRKACQLAIRQPTAEHFHEWRKQVKIFWYQLDFLCPKWPAKTKALLRRLEKLSDTLGDDHDLVLLDQFVMKQCPGSAETANLRQLIEARRRTFALRARRLGSNLYAETPGPVCYRLDKQWKTWRNGHN